MPLPRFSRALALLGAAFLTTHLPAAAEPYTVPFDQQPGATQQFEVRHLQAAVMNGRRGPVVSVGYLMDVTVDSISETGSVITVLNSDMDPTVDRNRFVGAPDFDTMVLMAVSDIPATIDTNPQGILLKVQDWENLRGRVKEQALALAGDDQAMAAPIDPFLDSLNEFDAVQLFARPLAMAAPARLITFEPPDKMSFRTDKTELPSFTSYAPARWTFDLLDRSSNEDVVTIEWLGVPDKEDLETILAPIGEQLAESLSDAQRTEIAENGRMLQRFTASYDVETGALRAFQGISELQAGPLHRRTGLEAVLK